MLKVAELCGLAFDFRHRGQANFRAHKDFFLLHEAKPLHLLRTEDCGVVLHAYGEAGGFEALNIIRPVVQPDVIFLAKARDSFRLGDGCRVFDGPIKLQGNRYLQESPSTRLQNSMDR